jgi:hypothetical protein
MIHHRALTATKNGVVGIAIKVSQMNGTTLHHKTAPDDGTYRLCFGKDFFTFGERIRFGGCFRRHGKDDVLGGGGCGYHKPLNGRRHYGNNYSGRKFHFRIIDLVDEESCE